MSKLLKNERCQLLPDIKTQKIEWCHPKPRVENGETIHHLPYPLYPNEVSICMKKFHELDLADYNYIENAQLIQNKRIEDLTINEICTKLTFYFQNERFCNGLIAEAMENGILEKLLTILKERTK